MSSQTEAKYRHLDAHGVTDRYRACLDALVNQRTPDLAAERCLRDSVRAWLDTMDEADA